MAWFSNALQGVREAKERVQQHVSNIASDIAARTQQLEEAAARGVQGGAFTAKEVEARLEADARSLSRTVQATEILQRWLTLLRSNPQPKYPEQTSPGEAGMPSMVAGISGEIADGGSVDLTFRQVFLRSRALELTLDTAARVPELRSHLREFAVASPEVWPDDKPPPIAFAHAFVELLGACLGPPQIWLSLVGALLSSEKRPADEACHAWIVQLIAGMRSTWADVDTTAEREREVEELEAMAKDSDAAEPEEVPSTASLSDLLARLAKRGATARIAYRACRMRNVLTADLVKATARQEELARMRSGSAAAIASAASERVAFLDAQAERVHGNTKELRDSLGVQATELRSQLEAAAPTSKQLEREIEEAELTKRELLLQVGQLSERLEKLRARHTERVEQEETLRVQLQQVDDTFKTKLRAEDKAHRRAEGARALAATVVDLAGGLAASGQQDSQAKDPQAVRLAGEAERSRKKAMDSALDLGRREVSRLQLAARVVGLCAEVAEERERSRQEMEKLGVPSHTLESDVVGEAEIAQSLNQALSETDRCRSDAEALCSALLEDVDTDVSGSPSKAAASSHAREVVKQIRSCLKECEVQRSRLAALLPQADEIEISTPPGEPADTVESSERASASGDASVSATSADEAGVTVADPAESPTASPSGSTEPASAATAAAAAAVESSPEGFATDTTVAVEPQAAKVVAEPQADS